MTNTNNNPTDTDNTNNLNENKFSEENIDYKAIGFKCGLEIHQQLDTGKLFCNCPSTIVDDKPDFIIERSLRVARGESGKIDAAVLHELQKNKQLIYHAHDSCTCLVELDEEPPHSINEKALDVVLIISQLFNSNILDEIHVMRKTVVDGSNTSGFQRTGLAAENGQIEVNKKSIRIESVCIEEDSAKIIEKTSHKSIYNLSRLGIPLIEIATAPDIKHPDDAKAVSAYIGMALRSTGKVKRGLGTIRQDVNVSITEGKRVEIKGAQELSAIPTLIKYEIFRQQSIATLSRKFSKININPKLINITKALSSCESKVIKSGLEKKDGAVYGIKIPNMKGEIGKELSPNKRLGSELSDYAKHASKVKGLFHCDELPKYGITEEDIAIINKELDCSEKDAFIIISDSEIEVKKALNAAIKRINRIPEGVIKEVRDAKPDGSTSFLRPMPGAARMYPETDVPVIVIDKNNLPSPPILLTEKKKILKNTLEVSNDLIETIFKTNKNISKIFENIGEPIKKLNKALEVLNSINKPIDNVNKIVDNTFKSINRYQENIKNISKNITLPKAYILDTIFSTRKHIKKKENIDIDPTEEEWSFIFTKIQEGEISKDNVIDILKKLKKNKPITEIVKEFKLMDSNELEKIVKEVLDANPGKRPNVLMGVIMGKIQGKASGKQVMELLTKLTS